MHYLCSTGVEALKLPEEGTVRSAGHFLAGFINLSRDPTGGCLQPVVAHNTETLVRTLMFCICMYILFINILQELDVETSIKNRISGMQN